MTVLVEMLLFLAILAVLGMRIDHLSKRIDALERHPVDEPPVPASQEPIRNVGEVAVEQHERRYHLKGN